MALFKRSGPHLSLSGPSSLFCNWKRKLLPFSLLPHSIYIIPTHTPSSPFSTLPERTYPKEHIAQAETATNFALLSECQSTKDETINAWLCNMRDSTLEKICNGHISLRYTKLIMENQSTTTTRSIAPVPRKVNHENKCKLLIFGGRIVYCQTTSEVEEATAELLDKIKAMDRTSTEKIPLGFDIEWKPSFKKGVTLGKTALVQICVDATCCYVMHIIHSGIPSILKSLLEDSSSVKVGIGIAGDATKIGNDYNVSVQSIEDLSDLASRKLVGSTKKWSLSSLTETVIDKLLDKRKYIRLGNWEAVLSKKQLQYAATDAFASWYLYKVLNDMPDVAVEKENCLEQKKKENQKKEQKKVPDVAVEKENCLEQKRKRKTKRKNRKKC